MGYFKVDPTSSILVNMGASSPIFGVKNPKIFETATRRHLFIWPFIMGGSMSLHLLDLFWCPSLGSNMFQQDFEKVLPKNATSLDDLGMEVRING